MCGGAASTSQSKSPMVGGSQGMLGGFGGMAGMPTQGMVQSAFGGNQMQQQAIQGIQPMQNLGGMFGAMSPSTGTSQSAFGGNQMLGQMQNAQNIQQPMQNLSLGQLLPLSQGLQQMGPMQQQAANQLQGLTTPFLNAPQMQQTMPNVSGLFGNVQNATQALPGGGPGALSGAGGLASLAHPQAQTGLAHYGPQNQGHM